METIKSYTDLEQSKKLAEILPLESADMCYLPTHIGNEHHFIASLSPYSVCTKMTDVSIEYCTPCWSVGALLGVLPFHLIINNQRYAFSMHKGLNKDGETYMLRYNVFNTDVYLYATDYYSNPVDACYELILKLHELNLL